MRSNYEMTQKHVSHEVFNAFIDRMVQKTNKNMLTTVAIIERQL